MIDYLLATTKVENPQHGEAAFFPSLCAELPIASQQDGKQCEVIFGQRAVRKHPARGTRQAQATPETASN